MRLIVPVPGQSLQITVSGRRENRSDAFSSVNDETLMCRFGNGDADAFETLYRRHRARLYRFVKRMIPAEADEIFQEVWLAVVAGKERYVPSGRFVTYLFSIAHHRAATRWRVAGRADDAVSVEEDALADHQPDPLAATLNAELGNALSEAINILPLVQREAFLMQAEGGLSLEEIAQASGTSRETVKSRLRYANQKLRQALESWK